MVGHRVRVTILPTETEIQQEIALDSQKLLEQLNPDFLLGRGDEAVRFGDLSKYEQTSLRQALAAQGRSEIEK